MISFAKLDSFDPFERYFYLPYLKQWVGRSVGNQQEKRSNENATGMLRECNESATRVQGGSLSIKRSSDNVYVKRYFLYTIG